MSKLTPEQFRLLTWMALPETLLEVSREVGFMDDKYNGLHNYIDKEGERYKFDIRTMYCLEGEGLIQGQYVDHLAVWWERYELTEKGHSLVLLNNAFKEFSWAHLSQ
jgi:hypothetical protein